jgi:hypothetical protein
VIVIVEYPTSEDSVPNDEEKSFGPEVMVKYVFAASNVSRIVAEVSNV